MKVVSVKICPFVQRVTALLIAKDVNFDGVVGVEDLVVVTYARRFEEYSGEQLVVRGSRPEGQRDIMVLSDIIRPNGPPVAVGWRVREQDAGMRIVDVVIEGVSQGITQRDEFRSIIQRNGGQLNALFEIMRDNIAEAG